jgi:hypothetical protein
MLDILGAFMTSKVNRWGTILTVVAGCVCIFWVATPALAMTQFLDRARRIYSLGKETGKCELCHKIDASKNEEASDGNINVYGEALKFNDGMPKLHGMREYEKPTEEELRILDAAFKAIDDKDTDGDGATNKEELMLATFPADPASVPTKEALEKFRKDKK